MSINDKQSLIEYCLRQLGEPVIKINVSQSQLEDRIDDALELFQEQHYDGTEEVWVAKTITNDDVTNGYVSIPADISTITQLGLSIGFGNYGAEPHFSAQYRLGQSLFNPYSVFGSADILDYYIISTSYNDIQSMITTTPQFEFVRHSNKLIINSGVLVENDYIFFKCFRIIDPILNTKIYSDRWLKQYATQLIKKQWGSNLSKHNNIQLLGGVTTNGDLIYEQAITDIEKLEEQLRMMYSEPTDFFVI